MTTTPVEDDDLDTDTTDEEPGDANLGYPGSGWGYWDRTGKPFPKEQP